MSFLCRMKRMISTLLLLCTCFIIVAQENSPAPPYKRFPTVAPFKLLLADSSTFYTKADLPKKKSVLMLLFSPDCEHCQHETEEIIKRIDDLKDVQIVMSTTQPLYKMKEFARNYGLQRFKNITIGQDVSHTLPPFYSIRFYPFLAFYNKKKELVSVFEGAMPIDRLIAETQK